MSLVALLVLVFVVILLLWIAKWAGSLAPPELQPRATAVLCIVVAIFAIGMLLNFSGNFGPRLTIHLRGTMDPNDINTVSTLLHSHAWLALALFAIPLLDKMIAEGQWPFSLVVSVKVRLGLITIGGASVVALQHVQSGGAWLDAVLSGLVVVAFALLKNGQSLFAKGAIPDAAAKVASLGLLLVVFASAPVVTGCAWLRANEPAIVQDAEVVIHEVEAGCVGMAWLDPTGTAQAICVALPDVDPWLSILERALAGNSSARITVDKGGVRRVVEIPREHVASAHADNKAAAKRAGK